MCSFPWKPSITCVRFSFQVQRALRSRHHSQFFRRHDHELPLLPIPHNVALDVVRAVVLRIFRQHALHFFFRLEIVVRKNSRPRGKRTQPDDVAAVHQVFVRKHVVRARLYVEARGDAIGQISQERPVLRVQNAAPNLRPVRVRVDKSGNDRFPGHIEHLRACWYRAFRPHALDPVIFDDDVRVLQNLLAFHRHYCRSPQHDRALRSLPRDLQVDSNLLDVLVLFFKFLFFFLLVLLFVLLPASARLSSVSFLSASFFSSSFGGSNEIALSGSRNKLAPTAQVIVFPSSAQLK